MQLKRFSDRNIFNALSFRVQCYDKRKEKEKEKEK
jgi:hypothetical protein